LEQQHAKLDDLAKYQHKAREIDIRQSNADDLHMVLIIGKVFAMFMIGARSFMQLHKGASSAHLVYYS